MMSEEPVRPDVDDEPLGGAVDPRCNDAIRQRLEPGVGFENPKLRRSRRDVVGRDGDADPDGGRDPFARRLVPSTAAPNTGTRLAGAWPATAGRLVLGCHLGQASEGHDCGDRRKK